MKWKENQAGRKISLRNNSICFDFLPRDKMAPVKIFMFPKFGETSEPIWTKNEPEHAPNVGDHYGNIFIRNKSQKTTKFKEFYSEIFKARLLFMFLS